MWLSRHGLFHFFNASRYYTGSSSSIYEYLSCTIYIYIEQIESGSALSVLLSTTIFVITVVKMLLICFLPQYSTLKKVFISERDQNHNTKKELALSITFSQYDWFISQNEHSRLAIKLRDKLTRAWRVQRCQDSYRQRKISQSDCEITSNCG